MKVRMLQSRAGLAVPRYGLHGTFSFAAGEIIELHDELAAAWIKSGNAEKIAAEKAKAKQAEVKPEANKDSI